MGLRWQLLDFKKNYSREVVFFFQICHTKFLAILLLFAFFLEFALFSILFPEQITKFQNNNT
jgi:hypothetical protein